MDGTILILGTARCLWDDLRAIGGPPAGMPRMAINLTGVFFPERIDLWATRHHERASIMRTLRERRHPQLKPAFRLHAPEEAPGVDVVDAGLPRNGTSSLFAVLVAARCGFTRAVLVGVPLDNTGHYYDPPDWTHGAEKYGDDHLLKFWTDTVRASAIEVRAVSGRLRDVLGGV